MLQKNNIRWVVLLCANVALWCVLGLYGNISAAPQGGRQPFANAVEQRAEMVRQMEEINASLKETNTLLRSGKVQVIIVEPTTP